LLDYAILKLAAMQAGATAIERKRDLVNVKFRQNAAIDPGKLARFVASQRGSQFTPDGTLKFSLKAIAADAVLQTLRDLLEELAVQAAPAAS
jgi:transcription-repair coupling factor (superfamily II helicase)